MPARTQLYGRTGWGDWRLSLKRRDRSSSVSRLLNRCSPSAIAGLVVSVVVLTIDAACPALAWGPAHVFQEVLETVDPALAHPDAASTVSAVPVAGRQVATNLHGTPCAIFLAVAVVLPMRAPGRYCCSFSSAATALRVTGFQGSSICHGVLPAVANAVPSEKSSASALFGCLRYNNKTFESLPNKIDLFHGVITDA